MNATIPPRVDPPFDVPNAARLSRVRRKRVLFTVAALSVIVVLAALCAFVLFGRGASWTFDPASQTGQAPYKTPAEVQAELDREVEEGMFGISIASTIDFAGPGSSGTAYIENVPSNRYDMKVNIVMDDTREEVYASEALAPGTYIEAIELVRPFAPGSYPATATFEAYDRDTHDLVGQAAAKVTIFVGQG